MMELQGKQLSDYTTSDLIELKTQASLLLEQKIEQQENEAIEKVVELVRDNRITYSKLMRALRNENAIITPTDESGNPLPIYYNPNNPTEVYDGTGRRPHWVKKIQQQGLNLDDYVINKEDVFNPEFS